MSTPSPTDDTVPHVAHDEFRASARHGRFRIVVNPALARPYVVRRTRVDLLAIVLIGVGAALALGGQGWTGLVLVALGIAANRVTRWQAGKIVLHLAERNAAVYREVTESGIVEVRRRE